MSDSDAVADCVIRGAVEMLVANGDIAVRVEVAGAGSPVVCVHGWPELARSWRHQVAHLTARGHRVAAIDVRGYGGSSAPVEAERYTLRELAGDVAAVIAALDDGPAILLGHDWGAPIVWNTAVIHPELVRGVVGMSVPYTPPLGFSLLDVFEHIYADRFFYMLHFCEPGVIESEFAADVRGALKKVYFALSGDAATGSWLPDAPRGTPFLSLLPEPPAGPLSFMSDDELDERAATFERTGLVGAVNRYRALAFDPAASADIVGATVDRPSCFIGGAFDPVRAMVPGSDLYADPGASCSDFRGTTIVEGAGHWVHQEAPRAVNTALDAFLATL